MLHLGRDVVEAARAKLLSLALVLEDGGPLNHGVGFVRAVPVYGHVHLFGRTDQQLRRVGLGIDPENRNLRRIVPQLRNHRLPPQIFVWSAHGLGSTAGRRCATTVALRRTKQRDQQQKTCDTARFNSSSGTHIHLDFLLARENDKQYTRARLATRSGTAMARWMFNRVFSIGGSEKEDIMTDRKLANAGVA